MRVETHRFERGVSTRCCSLMGEILARLAAPLSCYSHLPLASPRHNIFCCVCVVCALASCEQLCVYSSCHVNVNTCPPACEQRIVRDEKHSCWGPSGVFFRMS